MTLPLRTLAALPLAALLGACVSGTGTIDDPGQAKSAWQASRPDKYSYRMERSCFCLAEGVGPFLVEAEGSSVVRVRRVEHLGTSPDTIEVTEKLASYSIDTAFAWVDRMLARDNYNETVEYDPDYGFPSRADFDGSKQVADDEISLRITDFRKN